MSGESIDRVVGRIDGRTAAMANDIGEIKKGQEEIKKDHKELVVKVHNLKSDVDKLQTEHNDRVVAGMQCPPVVVNSGPNIELKQLLSGKNIGLVIIGALLAVGVMAAGAVAIMAKIVKVW